jgi:hypothetical protein
MAQHALELDPALVASIVTYKKDPSDPGEQSSGDPTVNHAFLSKHLRANWNAGDTVLVVARGKYPSRRTFTSVDQALDHLKGLLNPPDEPRSFIGSGNRR